jgi:hypothetical protein
VSIAASRTAVFAALTADPGGWWGHPFLRTGATGLNLERRLGGLLVETWEDGGVVLPLHGKRDLVTAARMCTQMSVVQRASQGEGAGIVAM